MDENAGGTSVKWELFTSRVLDDNPLGDLVTRRLPVLLPPGYDADSQAAIARSPTDLRVECLENPVVAMER